MILSPEKAKEKQYVCIQRKENELTSFYRFSYCTSCFVSSTINSDFTVASKLKLKIVLQNNLIA